MNIDRRGLIGSVIIHGLILALLILGGLTFPDPPPEEEGILVNFGTDDSGFGSVEPRGDEVNQGNPQPQPTPQVQESVESDPAPVTTPVVTTDQTQDVEEVTVKEDPKPTAEEIRQQQEAERIKREQEEAERKRLAEEEAERQRQLEEQRLRDQQANRLNNLGRNTFGNQGAGDEDGSEGVNPGDGNNQGEETGTVGAENYGAGSGLGNGPSYGLGNRKAVGDLPLPDVDNCNVTSRIVVTVEIQVDRNGKVVSASVTNATFGDNCIWNVVVEAARKTIFSSDPNASFKQSGWIKYTIEP